MGKTKILDILKTGGKLVLVNLISSVLTFVVYVFLAIIGVLNQNMFVLITLIIVYFLSILFIGGKVARMFGWK